MTLHIEGVPESLTRSQVVELLASIGIDAKHVTRHGGVVISGNAITAELYALNDNGLRFVDNGEAAVHRVTIPIVEDRP